MTLLGVLGVVAVAQAIFVLLLSVFVLVRRGSMGRRAERVREARARTGLPLVHWLSGDGAAGRIADALRVMPSDAALAFATELFDTRIPVSMRAGFGQTMRQEPWVLWALRGATSLRWWRRLDAARALRIAGTLADSARLRPLLEDEHPAVRLAGAQALAAVDDPELVRLAIARYPEEALAVRFFMTSTLKTAWRLAEQPLMAALASEAPPEDLAAWLNLAESLGLPSLRPAVTALAAHSSSEVRAPAARALRRYPHAESVAAAMRLLDDPQDYVRAAAAQALGALRAGESQPQLERGLFDPSWWVRFRSALSLALVGESGRARLRHVGQSADPFARDMAMMISGLSDGAVLELGDA